MLPDDPCPSIAAPITRSRLRYNLISKLCNAEDTTKIMNWPRLFWNIRSQNGVLVRIRNTGDPKWSKVILGNEGLSSDPL